MSITICFNHLSNDFLHSFRRSYYWVFSSYVVYNFIESHNYFYVFLLFFDKTERYCVTIQVIEK